jgi:hypothetical protein
MNKSIRMTILAVSLTLQSYANTSTVSGKVELTHEAAQKGRDVYVPQKPAGLNAPIETDRKTQPTLVSPICHGACRVASPWQTFLSAIGLG